MYQFLIIAYPFTLCKIGYKNFTNRVSQCLAYTRKLGNRRSSEGLHGFKPSNGTNLITLLILAGDIEMNPGPRFQCRLCKKYCKASDKVVECEDCEKCFHASCAKLGDNELLKLESGNGSWYYTNCKADCGLCSGAVLKGVFPFCLLPFRLLPFCLLPFRLLPFRLLSNFTSFPFRLQYIFVPAFNVVMVKHAMICIIV